MSKNEDKPVKYFPSLEELERLLLKKLREDASNDTSGEEFGSWEDFIEN